MGRAHDREPLLEAQPMDKVSFGHEDVEPQEKTRRVRGVFSSVASRYDLMNDLMSGGLHRLWKDEFVRQVRPRSGEQILDMAGGTGDIAFRLARRGAAVTVADINPDMLAVGVDRARGKGLEGLVWAEENAERLSFADKSFNAYTIAFGIRNVTHIDSALSEAYRVLRTGGRFFCLEFSQTRWPGFDTVYRGYSRNVVPKLGRLVAGDPESYRYLIESIERFPDMSAFARKIEKAGFARVRAEPILGGLVAIHSGWKI
jgi:demethylmenaquinone methyltransferase/2-methoxy-6-polyprenyl-1,4-benzoquinol methylase